MGFCGRQKGGNALCFLNGKTEGFSEWKHADYCIVEWLLIPLQGLIHEHNSAPVSHQWPLSS